MTDRARGRLAAGAATVALFAGLAVVVTAAGGAPLPGDLAVHDAAVGSRTRLVTGAAIAVTTSGTGVPGYLLAAAAGAAAVRRRRAPAAGDPRWPTRTRVGVALAVLALAGGQLVRAGLAAWIGRVRPPTADWAWHAGGPAFPSGHATTSALVAGLWWAALSGTRHARAGRRIAVGWAVAVGLTRVELGVHWPSDVLGGWLLASSLALVVAGLVRATARHPPPGRPGAPRDRVGAGP